MISGIVLFLAGGTFGMFGVALFFGAARAEMEQRAWNNGHDAGRRARDAEDAKWERPWDNGPHT
jgi:hypothetical protein